MSELADPAAAVERFDCPMCAAPAGSACRTRGGEVAPKYHTPRFMLVPRLRAELDVRTPTDRGPARLLPTIRTQFPEMADAAAREQMSYRGYLAKLLMAECDDRARRRSERRIKAAGFSREKSLRSFDFDANPSIDPAVINTLATCDWVKKGLPLCLIGDSGTGKPTCSSPWAPAMAGYRVRYTLATKLVNELVEEKASVAIASNESFSGWTKTFTDPRLCAAIVDRLTFGGNIIETGTDSYRLAQTRAAHQA
ncbi:ATP-binding protein [Sphaerisporangium sp. NBC_01403]|uniref:ATP-binding protein n=1 Tax=Sphaerisporangium sp. NBC_01403 TaxID=2903599 RepID=UPI0038660DF0